ncbi:insulin-like growth factor-binding protein 3 receptor [Hippoglossus hippoglossus]|uniref:insulin-like growth factor-binding protein 3 receptor n=1 Tax=Hippoglossus hippoglossus TaxID=8267 RepID=UPI00148DF4EB|nr:insulin-like growth factor-binding protein 3 receptor [Hippoglossus hippoglossus]
MMGSWHPVTNLRDYVSHNPPVVTFLLCMLSLVISFVCLGSYSYSHTLPNPDTAKDWNKLLSSLSQLQLCTKASADSSVLVSPAPSLLVEQKNDKETMVDPTKTSSSVTHLHLKVPVALTASSARGSVKHFGLYTSLRASQLHLGGNEIVNMTLEFLTGNRTHTCLNISAPSHLLPLSPHPMKCPAFKKNISPIHVEVSNQLPAASQTCYSLHSKNDPTLTVMLTQEERTVAVRHLLEVSVFLLGVCMVLCLAASVKRSLIPCYHWNGLDLKSEPLIDS